MSNTYPKELTISETKEATSVVSCLNVLLTTDESNNLTINVMSAAFQLGLFIGSLRPSSLDMFIVLIVGHTMVTFCLLQDPGDKSLVTG